MNQALTRVPKRAEQRQAEQLRDTFVDSGIAAAIAAIDRQVLYGRRGTGKTHALRYLETETRQAGAVAVYVDLRTVGSPDGLFMGESAPPTERASRLLIDLLTQFNDVLLDAVIDDADLIADDDFVTKLDALTAAITRVRVAGTVEQTTEGESRIAEEDGSGVELRLSSAPSVSAGMTTKQLQDDRALNRVTVRGHERTSLNFTDVARALRELAQSLASKRIWLLLDEWSSVPAEVQPYLAEFLVRCVLPLQMFTVKIAAIEQQSRFRHFREDGTAIGIELGADIAANVDLDEYMVFEQNEERATAFFRGLLYKHLTAGADSGHAVAELRNERDLVGLGFTDRRAFDELVRAAEGVPRDAINIVAKASTRAGARKISVPDIRIAARTWYQADKEAAVRGRADASRLLNWIIDKVIRQKKARGFLVNQQDANAPLLLALFDARVLHIVRRGYSAQDEPGTRYDVWVIDYGAYVDLINTTSAPQGLLPQGEDEGGGWVDVPTQDLRAIRRAILDLEDFSVTRS
jgi:hypothetical protein